MKNFQNFTFKTSLIAFLLLGANIVSAAPSSILNGGSPVWCFGMNQFDQCVLYLGTQESCNNLNPCIQAAIPPSDPSSGELFYCMGEDDLTGECKLLLGNEKNCNNVTKCSSVNKQLPRAPRRTLRR